MEWPAKSGIGHDPLSIWAEAAPARGRRCIQLSCLRAASMQNHQEMGPATVASFSINTWMPTDMLNCSDHADRIGTQTVVCQISSPSPWRRKWQLSFLTTNMSVELVTTSHLTWQHWGDSHVPFFCCQQLGLEREHSLSLVIAADRSSCPQQPGCEQFSVIGSAR